MIARFSRSRKAAEILCVEAFSAYMKNEGKQVTRALFERNLVEKRKSAQFSADIAPLLASGYAWDRDRAAEAAEAAEPADPAIH